MGEKEWEYKHGKFMRNSPPILGIIVCRDNIPHGEIAEILNAQSAEIAELRKEIAELTEIINGHEWKDVRWSDEPPNPSEIPNSSEFIVTEADQREADKAIADGSAKLQMPVTGHGITEVSDAAEG